MPRFIDFRALKERFDVLDALEHYGYFEHMEELANGQFKGPCLLHSDDFEGTSFKVTPSSQGFHCFGCGAKGNVLDLVAARENLDVHRAAVLINEWLAAKAASTGEVDKPQPSILDEEKQTYQAHVRGGLPVYSVRLVRETEIDTAHFDQCKSPEAIFAFLQPYFAERDREEFVAVLLDTALQVIGLTSVSVGGLNFSIVEPAQVFKPAILANAQSVILAHNHPSGNSEPSSADVGITKQLVKAGEIIGIPVRDHLIITEQPLHEPGGAGVDGDGVLTPARV